MSTSISHSIAYFDDNFTGRPDMGDNYHADRMYRVHPRNRAEAWKQEHRKRLLKSLLEGFYIPPIIVHVDLEIDAKGHPVERRSILDGGQRATAIRRILLGEVAPLTPDELTLIRSTTIQVVLLRGLSSEGIRQQFRLLNKVVAVTPGHLYDMSHESPLVQCALSLLNDTAHPLRARITQAWYDTQDADTNAKGALANAVAICAGILHGPEHITKSFDRNEVYLLEPVNTASVYTMLSHVLDVFDSADIAQPMADQRKRKGEMAVGKYIGPMIYDMLTDGADLNQVKRKWADIVARCRRAEPLALEASTVKGAQNLTRRKLQRISIQVDFMRDRGRMPSDDEVKAIVGTQADMDDESTLDDDEDDM